MSWHAVHWLFTSIEPVCQEGVAWPPWQLTFEQDSAEEALLNEGAPLLALYVAWNADFAGGRPGFRLVVMVERLGCPGRCGRWRMSRGVCALVREKCTAWAPAMLGYGAPAGGAPSGGVPWQEVQFVCVKGEAVWHVKQTGPVFVDVPETSWHALHADGNVAEVTL